MASEKPNKVKRAPGDLKLYLRLLGYVRPYWYIFVFSIMGYIVYSLGSVLFADILAARRRRRYGAPANSGRGQFRTSLQPRDR